MNSIFENWNSYILSEEVLTEVSFADAQKVLDSKRTVKIIKGWRYDKNRELEKRGFEVSDDKGGIRADFDHRKLKESILHLIPNDIEDGQKGTAILWILKMIREDAGIANDFITGRIGDYMGVERDLETFFHHQNFMPKPDLLSIKTIRDFEMVVSSAQDEIEKAQHKKLYLDAEQGTEIFRDDAEWRIYALHNKGASCHYGKGTKWCTAAPGLKYFEQYYKPDDPLFYFEKKSGKEGEIGERWQFHYGSKQFMNSQDERIDREEVIEYSEMLLATPAASKYPIIEKYLKPIFGGEATTPPEVLIKLASDEDAIVRKAVARNHAAPPEALAKLAMDERQMTIADVAENPAATAEILAQLARHPNEIVRQKVAANPSTTPEILSKFSLKDEDMVLKSVIDNQKTPPEFLAKFISPETDSYLKKAVAVNPRATPEVLEVLASDEDPYVREAVASNPSASAEMLSRLVFDDEWRVSNSVLGNLNTPSDALAKIAKQIGIQNSTDRRLIQIADHPNTPPETLAILAWNHDYPRVQKSIGNNPNTPVEVLVKFAEAEGDSSHLQEFVAANPNLPVEYIMDFLEDSRLRIWAVKNPSIPEDIAVEIASSEDDYLKRQLSYNESLPVQAIEVLANSDTPLFRELMAVKPTTPIEILLKLLSDPERHIQGAVERNRTYKRYLKSKQITESIRKRVRKIITERTK
jgi:hypothetical protein